MRAVEAARFAVYVLGMLPRWVWPKENPCIGGKRVALGRALHLFGLIVAVVIWIPTLVFGSIAAVFASTGYFGWASIAAGFGYVALYTGAGAAAYFAGRGLRYVLSKE